MEKFRYLILFFSVWMASCFEQETYSQVQQKKGISHKKEKLIYMMDGYAELRPNFSMETVKIGDKELQVEVAKNSPQRQFGLMYVEKMNENHGMLFVFEQEKILKFWMKNTFIPLSIAFLNKDKKIVEIKKMNPPRSVLSKKIPTVQSSQDALYALEVNQGWFEKNGVKKGDILQFNN